MQATEQSKGYELNIFSLMPFLSRGAKRLGRTIEGVTEEILEEYLNSDKERYIDLKGGKYLLYLDTGRQDLDVFKMDIIGKEIRRRLYRAIEENYPSQPGEDTAAMSETSSKSISAQTVRKRRVSPPKKESGCPAEESGIDYDALGARTEVFFRPVWNVSKNHLTGVIARHKDESMNVENAKDKEDHFLADVRARADLGLLVRSATELTKALEQNRKTVVIVPVFFDTLVRHPFREQYLEYCRRISPQVRALMVLQIKRISPYASKERVQAIQKDISGLMRSLILVTDLRDQNFNYHLSQNVHACAVFLAHSPDEESCSIGLMERFVEKMQTINRVAMVDGIASRSMLCAAVSAGFAYISGPAIQPDQPDLEAVRPFSLQAVYE